MGVSGRSTQATLPLMTIGAYSWGSLMLVSANRLTLRPVTLVPSELQLNVIVARVAVPNIPPAVAPTTRMSDGPRLALHTPPMRPVQPATETTPLLYDTSIVQEPTPAGGTPLTTSSAVPWLPTPTWIVLTLMVGVPPAEACDANNRHTPMITSNAANIAGGVPQNECVLVSAIATIAANYTSDNAEYEEALQVSVML